MFYEEDEINSLLICKLCQQKLVDPRVLNCGNTVCHKCIIAIYDKQTNGFDCIFCFKFHIMPKIGFPVNEIILKLSDKKPKEVYRGEIYENLKHRLETIDLKCEKLQNDFNNIPKRIKEQCSITRDQVDIVTNDLIELISKYRVDLIEKVNDYERDCINNYKNNYLSFHKRLDELFKQVRLFHDKWNEYLKRTNIDEMQLNKANDYASDWVNKLLNIEQIFKRIAFNDKLLHFETNNLNTIDSKIIGKITYDPNCNDAKF